MDFYKIYQAISLNILSIRSYNIQERLRSLLETNIDEWREKQRLIISTVDPDFTVLYDNAPTYVDSVISVQDSNIYHYLMIHLKSSIWEYYQKENRPNYDLLYGFANIIKMELQKFEYEYEKIRTGNQVLDNEYESYNSHDLNQIEYITSFEMRIILCKDFLYFLSHFLKDFKFELSEQDKIDLNLIDKKYEVQISPFDLPEIDLSTQKEQIRLLNELGIIDFLIKKYPNTLKGNNNQVASLIGKILKIKTQTIQPTINALLNETTNNKNYPQITKSVKAIIDKLESNKTA